MVVRRTDCEPPSAAAADAGTWRRPGSAKAAAIAAPNPKSGRAETRGLGMGTTIRIPYPHLIVVRLPYGYAQAPSLGNSNVSNVPTKRDLHTKHDSNKHILERTSKVVGIPNRTARLLREIVATACRPVHHTTNQKILQRTKAS